MNTWSKFLGKILAFSAFFSLPLSEAARLKDVASVKGVRENILIGYGIVVGLNGSGDSSTDVTAQSLGRLFEKLGLDMQDNVQVKSKNAAAVIVTASLPPFARKGTRIDITVSSIGDAASLEGGVLLVTPLRAGDQNVYAVAQGKVSIGSKADGNSENFPTVGRVVNGATIEKDMESDFSGKKSFRLALHNPDFTTAARLVESIDANLGGRFASARDSGTVDVVVPFNYEGNTVELLAVLENISVNVDSKAKVILNERTGTVIMGQGISISPVAIAHGDLSIEVMAEAPPTAAPAARPPANNNSKPQEDNKKDSPKDNGAEMGGNRTLASGGGSGRGGKATMQRNRIIELPRSTNVSDLVKGLNALGVQPKDLTAIFQALKKSGALQAELEFM